MPNTSQTSVVITPQHRVSDVPPFHTFRVPLSGNINLAGKQMAIKSVAMFYSWPNIVSSGPYSPNNVFQYKWVDGITYTVTLPQGGYDSTVKLNDYLKFTFDLNKHYLIDSTGAKVYYGQLVENAVLYGVQWNASLVPTSLGTLTMPVGSTWSLPGVATGPQLIINQAGFGAVIGFALGSYPAALPVATFSAISTVAPQISPVSTVFILSSISYSSMAGNTQVVEQFMPIDTSYGQGIYYAPAELAWTDCVPAQQSEITIRFCNQNMQPLQILDPQTTIQLLFRNKN